MDRTRPSAAPAPVSPRGYNFQPSMEATYGLINRGMPQAQAVGYASNMSHEANMRGSLDPGAIEQHPIGGGRGGAGLAQWTGPRRRDFENYLAQNGKSPGDMNANLDFFHHELQQNPWVAQQHARVDMNDPRQATRDVMKYYERPNAAHAHLGERLGYADAIQQRLADADPFHGDALQQQHNRAMAALQPPADNGLGSMMANALTVPMPPRRPQEIASLDGELR